MLMTEPSWQVNPDSIFKADLHVQKSGSRD